ncbi:hypothetical protein N183_38080 [Sinorhizobium sp. Sb3]|nr:hypothetical protein N183_38080 [Sinorhizobium sp. Sb3]
MTGTLQETIEITPHPISETGNLSGTKRRAGAAVWVEQGRHRATQDGWPVGLVVNKPNIQVWTWGDYSVEHSHGLGAPDDYEPEQ